MNGSNNQALEERKRYVDAFNSTMVKIWKEKIALLGAIDTGALLRSVVSIGVNANGEYTTVSLTQGFNLYGLFVDRGSRENGRKAKRWFLPKHFSSVRNLRDFFAENLGKESANVISNALTPSLMHKN